MASSHCRGGHAEGHPVGGGCHGATCSRGCGPSLVRQCDLQMVTGRVRGGVQGSGGSLVGQDGAWSSSPQPLWPPHPIALTIPNALFMSPIQRPPFSIPVTLARGAPPHRANTPVPRISVLSAGLGAQKEHPLSPSRANPEPGSIVVAAYSQSELRGHEEVRVLRPGHEPGSPISVGGRSECPPPWPQACPTRGGGSSPSRLEGSRGPESSRCVDSFRKVQEQNWGPLQPCM